MENEVRYYLDIIKKAMAPVTEEEAAAMTAGEMEVRKPFAPTHIVTATKLPTGAVEIAVNTSNIAEKIDYILEAYDENMCLKTNPEVSIANLMII